MKQPVFFTSDPLRKSQFRVETKIWQSEDGTFLVEKVASSVKAVNHLKNMIDTCSFLASLKNFKQYTYIAPAKIYGEQKVSFPYIKGTSAERILLNNIFLNEEESIIIIDKLINIIKALPTEKINPSTNKNYSDIFGKTFNTVQSCTSIALIDLNFDNFIINNKNQWYLIDYEWSFKFPIAQNYLISRALWYFIYRHREIFRYHSQNLNCLKLAEGIYVPEFLYKKYKEYIQYFDEVQKAEKNFQNYVLSTNTNQPTITFFNKPEQSKSELLGIERIVNHAEKAKELHKLKEEIKKLRYERNSAVSENNNIKNSRSYKLARRIASAKQIISRINL